MQNSSICAADTFPPASSSDRGRAHTSVPCYASSALLPLIEQLKTLGWQHVKGDTDVPYLTERDSFKDVLLTARLCDAVRRINVGENGDSWLDETRINEAAEALERLGARKPMEANQAAAVVAGDPEGALVYEDESWFVGKA